MWVFIWLAFTLFAYKAVDPDFGWHLQIGRMLLTSGIPATDPFSYTMPSFPWVDHGRLSDMVIAWVYDNWGLPVLAVLFSTLGVAAMFLSTSKAGRHWFDVPVLLGSTVLISRMGIRPQIEDWVMLAGLLLAFETHTVWRRWRWTIPIGFAVWANFHGGFGVGIVMLLAAIVVRAWEERRWEFKDIGVWVLSLLATGVNPYGFRLWHEIWLTMSDRNLRGTIVEWQPFWSTVEMGFWLLVGLTTTLIQRYWKSMPKWRLATAGLGYMMALSSVRYAPMAIITGIPLATFGLEQFYNEIRGDKTKIVRARKFYVLLLVVVGLVWAWELGSTVWGAVKRGGVIEYPVGAVEYIRRQEFEGQLFAPYAWGGYLIWKMPERKVFVDGRMPSWRWDAPNENESDWAFKDYLEISNGDEMKKHFDKYNVTRALVAQSKPDESIMGKIVSRVFGNGTRQDPGVVWIDKLKELGWEEEYSDGVARVFRKKM